MDSTHKSNYLNWKLFTIMVKEEHVSWISEVHMLSNHEDGDIIAQFL